MDSCQIILKPLITEKSLGKQEVDCYSFWVHPKASKNQIKEAVRELFGVNPVSVRTQILKGEIKKLWRQGRIIRTGRRKKAVVQLKKGEKISLMAQKKK